MEKINSSQKKYLRSLAHHLKPLIIVGKNGIGGQFIASVDAALNDHELIKIKFGEFKEEKKEMAARIAQETQSEIAGIIGHVVIFYRRHPQPQHRKIEL
jgi:RNA-binding protein